MCLLKHKTLICYLDSEYDVLYYIYVVIVVNLCCVDDLMEDRCISNKRVMDKGMFCSCICTG